MQRLKKALERRPGLYRVVRTVFLPFALRYTSFKRYLRRNKLGELWAAGYFHKGSPDRESYSCPMDVAHRSFLISRVADFSPLSSVLEIGCDTGPNLYLLARKFPTANFRGIDINPAAIKKGRDWLAREGITNVELSVGKAEGLGEFTDKSFDVVFTDAVLIYVSRDKIYSAVKEMLRVARKGLILLERHDYALRLNDKRGLGIYVNDLWVRDYKALLGQFVPLDNIYITKITEDIWPDEGWKQNGALIRVTLP